MKAPRCIALGTILGVCVYDMMYNAPFTQLYSPIHLQFPSVHFDDGPPSPSAGPSTSNNSSHVHVTDPPSRSANLDVPSMSNDSSHVHVTDISSHSGQQVRVIQLDPGPSSSSEASRENPIEIDGSSRTVLNSQVIDQSSEYSISVNRTTADSLWLSAVSFYKGAMVRPAKLRKQLVVNFSETGEIGADSGALRKEFLEDALKEMNLSLFDGEESTRIPKKDYNLQMHFEMAGMLVAHSVLQEGPGFPCMSEDVYDFIVKGECYPCKGNTPLDIGTVELHSFIEKVNLLF